MPSAKSRSACASPPESGLIRGACTVIDCSGLYQAEQICQDLPSSIDSIVEGTGNAPQVLEAAPKPPSDIEYLQELIAIQQNGPKNIGFFGTRNMGFLHQQLIEILSYAMVLTVRKRPFSLALARARFANWLRIRL